jgi:prolyl-tRNA synthetase
MRGVPLRIEIGPKDIANQSVVLARRDIPGREGKSFVSWNDLTEGVPQVLTDIQKSLFNRALEFRKQNTYYPDNYEDFKSAVEDGFAIAWWCGSAECELAIKNDTKATNRCIPLEQEGGSGKCIYCGGHSNEKAVFAKAY